MTTARSNFGLLMTLSLASGACRCGPPVVTGAEGELRVAPSSLDFGAQFIGTSTTREVIVTNEGRAAQRLLLSIGGPFALDAAELMTPAGDTSLARSLRAAQRVATGQKGDHFHRNHRGPGTTHGECVG